MRLSTTQKPPRSPKRHSGVWAWLSSFMSNQRSKCALRSCKNNWSGQTSRWTPSQSPRPD
jgi:hypothetical protein